MKVRSFIKIRFRMTLGTLAVLLATLSSSQAASKTWTGATGATWDTGTTADWTGSTWSDWDDATFGNTGSGTVTIIGTGINANTLTFSANGSSSAYTISGGTLTLQSTATITATANGTISAVLSGAGSGLTKAGTGILTLSGANTISGGTTISAGTVVAGNANALGTSGTITLGDANSGANAITLGSTVSISNPITVSNNGTGTVTIGSGAGNFNGAITLYRDVALNGQNNSFNGGISGTGNMTITSGGGWTVYFGNRSAAVPANTFAGNIYIISGAILNLCSGWSQSASLIPDSATVNVLGTLNINKGVNNETIDALTGNGSVILSSGTLTIGGGSGSGLFTGSISSVGALTKIGSGTQTLTTGVNTYSGGTTISGGTLVMGSSQSLGTISAAGNTGSVTLNSGTATLVVKSTGTIGALSGVSLSIINVGTTSAITLTSSGTGTQSTTFSGAMQDGTGTLSFTKIGTGTLTLNGVNTYSGGTTISGGQLVLGSNSGCGTISAAGNTGSVTLNSGTATLIISSTGTIGALSSGHANDGTITSTGLFTLTSSGTGTQSTTFSGVMQDGSGTLSFTKIGTGTLTLSGANTYTGGTVINGGTLVMGGGTALGTITAGGNTGSLTLTSGVLSLAVNSGTIGALTGSAGTTITGGTSGAITLTSSGTGTANTTFSGVIQNGSGTLSFTKTGTGTLTLTAANPYTGATAINAGTLALGGSGSIGSSATINVGSSGRFDVSAISGYTVNNNQSLQGSGTIVGSVSLAGGAHIAPGSGGIGTLNVGSLTLAANSLLDFDITDTTSHDQINVLNSGGLILNGGTLSINGGIGAFSANGTYNLINYVTSFSGSGTLTLNALNVDSSKNYVFGNSGTMVTLTISDKPTGTPEWTGASGNTWSTAGSWSSGVAPNTGTVNFGTSSSSGAVTLNQTATLAGMLFHYNVATTISDGGTILTLANGGGATISVEAGAVSHSIAPAVALTDPATITVGSLAGLTLSGTITGSGTGIVKAGAGSLTLSGNNAYTGGTTLNAGILTIANNDNNLGTATSSTAGTLTVNGGTLQFGTAITIVNRPVVLGGVGYLDTSISSGTITALISGGGSLTKVGANTLILGGANTYTGGTILNAGILTIANNDNNLGTATSSTAGTLTINGGTLQFGAAITIANRPVVLGGVGYLDTSISSGSITALISGGGSLTKTGANTLTLGGANTYTGGTTLNGGWLAANNNAALGAAGSTITFNGGTLQAAGNLTIGNSTISLGATAATVDTMGNSLTLSGIISGSGSLTKAGTGTLTLNNANTYNGGTTLSAGTLVIGNANALGTTGSITLGDANSGANAIQLSATTAAIGNAITVSNNGTGGVTFNTIGSGQFTGAITLNRNITVLPGNNINFGQGGISGTGSMTIADGGGCEVRLGALSGGGAANTFAGNLYINSSGILNLGGGWASSVSVIPDSSIVSVNGTLKLNKSGNNETVGALTGSGAVTFISADTLTVGGGTFTGSATFSGAISGSGAIAKIGAGTQIFSGANTYTGTTTVNGGTLSVGGVLTAGSAGNLGSVTTSSGTLTLGGGVLQYTGAGTTIDRPWQLAASTGSGIDVTNANTTLTISTAAPGTSGSLTKSGAGLLALTGANAYTGATTVNAGTLSISGSGSIGSGALMLDGGAFQIAANSLTLANAATITGGKTGTIDVTSGNTATLSGNFGATSGALTKVGGGVLVLGGNNAYSGLTTVNTGMLTINSASATGYSGGVSVGSGATLGGSGTISGLVTGGGHIAPGNSMGTLNAGSLTLNSTILDFEFSDDGTSYDQIKVFGNNGLAINSGTLNLFTTSGAVWSPKAGQYNLIAYQGTFTGSAGSLTVGNEPPRYACTFGSSGGWITLNIVDTAAAYEWVGNNNNLWNTGANWSGGMAPGAGTLTVNFGTLNSSGAVLLNSQTPTFAAVTFRPDVSTTISGPGIMTFNGGGAGATVVVDSGALHTIGSGVSVVLADNTTITANGGLTISDAITGGSSDSLTMNGTGTLTLTGNNSYTGVTTLSAGVLSFGNGALGGTATITMNGGTLQWNGSNTQDISPRLLLVNGKTATFDIASGNSVTLTTGFGSGTSGGLTKIGGGVLTLGGVDTYTGLTTINAGTLSIGTGGSLSSSSVITFGGGAFQFGGNNLAFNNAINLATAGTIDTLANTGTLGGLISGNGSLVKTGAGTLTITGNNSYTGGTTLDGGWLAVNNNTALGAAGSTITFNGGTLQAAGNITLGNSTISLGTAAVVDTMGNNLTLGGVISGSGSLTKMGTGTLTLNAANAYTGGTTISAGTVIALFDNAMGTSGSITLGSASSGATLLINYTSGTIARPITVAAGTGTVVLGGTAGGDNTRTFSGAITLNRDVTLSPANGNFSFTGGISGTGNMTITSGGGYTVKFYGNTFNGDLYLPTPGAGGSILLLSDGNSDIPDSSIVYDNGILKLNKGGNNETIGALSGSGAVTFVNSDTLTVGGGNGSGTFSGIVSGSGAITKIGVGTQTFSGANSYAGGTTITNGTLAANNASALGSGPVALTNALLQLEQSLTLSSNLYGNAGAFIDLGPSADVLTVNQGGSSTFAGAITNAGAIAKSGAGTLTFSGANTYAGGTTITNGVLVANNASALGSGTVALTNALLQLAQSLTLSNNLSGDATGVIDLGSAADVLTVSQGGNSTFAGSITNAGAFTKSGAGTLTLSGTNTYTGVTTINAGTLALGGSGAISNSPVITIAGGATCDVSAAGVALGAGKTLQASGNALGGVLVTASGKDLTLASASPLNFTAFKPAGSGGAVPLTLSGAGNLNLGVNTPVTVTVTGSQLQPGTYKLIATNGAGGVVATLPAGTLTVGGAGYYGIVSLKIAGGELFLQVDAVPTKLVIAAVNSGANPTVGIPFDVEVQTWGDTYRGPVSVDTSVTLSRTTGSGTLAGTLTKIIPAGSNSVTFTGVTYTKAESGVVFTVATNSGTSLTSNNVTVTVNAGAVNAGASTVGALPGTIMADGVTISTVTVTLKDAYGDPVPGKTVALASSRGGTDTISPASGVSDASGVVTFTVSSGRRGTPVITASDMTDSIVAGTVTITVTPFTEGTVYKLR